jgi:RNA polymerase sigma-70 factor (ECF subfamily)
MERSYKSLGDLELMSLVSTNDTGAFAEIYQRYKHVLYTHAYRMLGNDDEAKDVLQDVFTSIWDRRHSIALRSSLSSYLIQSTKHRILNIISSKKTEDRYLRSLDNFIEAGSNTTDLQLGGQELQQLIEEEISLLPEKMREVFKLSSTDEFSYQEIGGMLGISDKTVKKQVHKARSILRKKLTFFTFLCFPLL